MRPPDPQVQRRRAGVLLDDDAQRLRTRMRVVQLRRRERERARFSGDARQRKHARDEVCPAIAD